MVKNTGSPPDKTMDMENKTKKTIKDIFFTNMLSALSVQNNFIFIEKFI